MSTAKEELAKLIEAQPDDSSSVEIVRELAFHVMVQRGLADSDADPIPRDYSLWMPCARNRIALAHAGHNRDPFVVPLNRVRAWMVLTTNRQGS